MALSYDVGAGDGVTRSWLLSFPYINAAHVKVTVDGVLVASTTVGSTVTLDGAVATPPIGAEVKRYRETPRTPLVEFGAGTLNDSESNRIANLQLIYLAQEDQDAVDDLGAFDRKVLRVAEDIEAIPGEAEDRVDMAVGFDDDGDPRLLDINVPLLETLPSTSTLLDRFLYVTPGGTIAGVPGPLPPVEGSTVLEQFGVEPNLPGDQSANLQLALNAVAGSSVVFPPGEYIFSQFSIPNYTRITAAGAIFRSAGNLNEPTEPSITVGIGARIDELHYSTPGTEVDLCPIFVEDYANIERIILRADAQRAGDGVRTRGVGTRIGLIDSENFDRYYNVLNEDAAPTFGSYLGLALAKSVVRGPRIAHHHSFYIGDVYSVGLSPNAVLGSPGQNTILLEGAWSGKIGDVYSEDASEHCVRIGGSTFGGQNKDIDIGFIKAIRPGGCALKINPTILVSPGVTETADNISVRGVHGIDVGESELGEGNEELIRITHGRGIRIGPCYADRFDKAHSCQYVLLLNDTIGLRVASIGARDVRAGMVLLDETSDCDGVDFFAGGVVNVRIDAVEGNIAGNNAIGIVMPNFEVANLSFNGIDLLGVTATLALIAPAQTITGPISFSGYVGGGSVEPLYSGPASAFVQFDMNWLDRSFGGRPDLARWAASTERTVPAFQIGATPTHLGGVYLNAAEATSGLGAYGGSVSFSRVGSGRRGAALVAEQTGSDLKQVGVSVMVGNSGSTANEALAKGLTVDHLLQTKIFGALALSTPAIKVADFSVTATETVLFNNKSAAACTVTLPDAASFPSRILVIVNYQAQAVNSNASNVVPRTGAAAGTVICTNTAGQWTILMSDGTVWRAIAGS